MALKVVELFKVIIIVSLFYGGAVTMLTHGMPPDTLNYVSAYSEPTTSLDVATVSGQIQTSLDRQTDIPLINLGALVFYSGNILIDLLLNFSTAIPQMITMIFYAFGMFFGGLEPQLLAQIETFFIVAVMAMYFISIVQLLVGVRSGKIV